MGVDQKSGGHDGQKDPAVSVVEAARRPDQRFLAAPLLDGGHGYLSLFWLRLAKSSCAFAALVVWTWRKRMVSWSGAIASPRSGGSSMFMSKHLDADKSGEDVHLHRGLTAEKNPAQILRTSLL